MASHCIVAALLIVGLLGLNQAPQGAGAQTPGSACMFNAPTGAGGLIGHVGYGILDPVKGLWYFGTTENVQGSPSVPPGGDDQHWMASGSKNDMLNAFMSTGHFHKAWYYTKYRCFDGVASYNVTAALEVQARGAKSGYWVLDNNCLTKSVDIFNAYAELDTNNGLYLSTLDRGNSTAPNFYFDGLFRAGWGPVIDLPYPAGLGCMFNAPSGATVEAGLGHVGWGFLDPETGNWTFGATENHLGNSSVTAGGDTQSWIASGSQTDMYAAFKNAGYFHPANYYVEYVCHPVDFGDVRNASTTQKAVAGSGYDYEIDNCLTKAVAILSGYGETSLYYPGGSSLNPASFISPNDYMNSLPALGWGLFNGL